MLNKDPFVVHPDTFKLIQELQKLPFLQDFYLVGGTSLALQIGHRNSIDIDLFTQNTFSTEALKTELLQHFDLQVAYEFENTLMCFINNIKVDFIRHNSEFVKEPILDEQITYLSKEDIAAMKFNVIVQSGKRLKDFIDIYYLLEYFSIDEMSWFYKTKYPHMNRLIPMRALVFFDEIDPNLDPPILKKPIAISKIKKRISEAVLQFPHKKYKP